MFTGLVQHVGKVRSVTPTPTGVRLVVDASGWSHRPGVGDSIAVSGCCLTVAADAADGVLRFDVIPESLAKTSLGSLREGWGVNLEHAATPSTLLGGHLVQGHVDGVGEVVWVNQGSDWRVRVKPPADLMPFMVPKGSVTLEGVSLTLARVEPAEGFIEVALIPTTLEKTTLARLSAGSRANVEADACVKALVHWARHYAGTARP